jgi:hypothetical protein
MAADPGVTFIADPSCIEREDDPRYVARPQPVVILRAGSPGSTYEWGAWQARQRLQYEQTPPFPDRFVTRWKYPPLSVGPAALIQRTRVTPPTHTWVPPVSEPSCSLIGADPPWQWSWSPQSFVPFSEMRLIPGLLGALQSP